MKLIIAGGRDFNDKVLAFSSFIEFAQEVNSEKLSKVNPFTEIVSGGAINTNRELTLLLVPFIITSLKRKT